MTIFYPLHKYSVTDRESGQVVTEPTFTIKVESDPHAKAALLAYAASVEAEDRKLANDLRAAVR